METKKLAGILALASAFAAAPAHATLMLNLDDGIGNTLTIADGGSGDINGAGGAVTWLGSLGGWLLNVSTGVSNSPGAAGAPASLDLNSINQYMAPGLGTLTITVSDSGWTTPVGPITATTNVGGTLSAGGSASFQSFYNGTSLMSLGTYTTGNFSGGGNTEINAEYGYSLKEIATLTQVGPGGPMSFDMHTQVPEPGTLALLGLGLLGMGVVRRRRAS